MNRKIEQLLDLALSSPAAEDMKIRAKLIEDARQLDYLTASSEETIELLEGFHKDVSKNIDIDLVLRVYYEAGKAFVESFAPNLDFDVVVAAGIVTVAEQRENDKNRKI